MKKSCSTCTVNLKMRDQMLTEYYFAVRYGDIIILFYHEEKLLDWTDAKPHCKMVVHVLKQTASRFEANFHVRGTDFQ